jgi:transposase
MIRYKKEFKQSLVEMHNQGRSYTDLSAEYGPSVDSIRNWVKVVRGPRSGRRKMDTSLCKRITKGKRPTSRRT